jgi:hypothetical protein
MFGEPYTPLGAVELVPTAAIFEPGADTNAPGAVVVEVGGTTATKVPDGASLYFELPNAPSTVPPA